MKSDIEHDVRNVTRGLGDKERDDWYEFLHISNFCTNIQESLHGIICLYLFKCGDFIFICGKTHVLVRFFTLVTKKPVKNNFFSLSHYFIAYQKHSQMM